jgi:adenylate cyclase
MNTERFKRKLTAILSADVKGYSRLMGEDEEETVRTITAHREVMAKLIEKHQGRVVDSPGDNLLADFTSVLDAVRCAVEIQEELKAQNSQIPENRRMEFRIGINMGDVIQEGERIYGDGVNIAARVEGLAEAGGICISGTVYEHIKNKLALWNEYLGEHDVKNIAEPVRVYKVRMEPGVAAEERSEKRAGLRRWQWMALGIAAGLVVGIGALSIWYFYLRPSPQPAGVISERAPVLELPDKPSIAVLPFVNIGGEPEQEYFSDGITEEIITTLSKVPQLFVIARNSTFAYKGKSVKVQQVGQDLGVRYILEGSVRKAGDRVRITAQLVDATTGGHLWSERYDRELKDIFALQDEITMEILTAVRVKLTDGEQARLYGEGSKNLDSYLKVLQGMPYFHRFNTENNARARQLFEEAIALDPEDAQAKTMLAWTHLMEVVFGSSESPVESMTRAADLAQKVIALHDIVDAPHSLLGNIYLMQRQYEKAVSEAERAVALNPNGADACAHLGRILIYAGRQKEAIQSLEKAVRLNPIPPTWYLFSLGDAYFLTGQYDEAIAAYKRVFNLNPDDMVAHVGLAATYAMQRREEEAGAQAAQILRISPKFYIDAYASTLPFENKADRDLLIDGLRKAGGIAKCLQSLAPNEVFKYKGPPAFSITYPRCYKQSEPRSQIKVFYAYMPFGKSDFGIDVRDVRLGEKIEGYSDLWINYLTKHKIGADFDVISSEPKILEDGTPAKFIVIKWQNLRGWPVESRIFVLIKDNRLISIQIHGGSGEKIDIMSENV